MADTFEHEGWEIRLVDDAERFRRGETSQSVKETYLFDCVTYIEAFDLHVRETYKVPRDLFDTDREAATRMLSEFLQAAARRAIEERVRSEERM